ncbi:MAG: hypothetical protein IAI48_08240, partial [Candidatus Eremiobacteraeota bacterium]|nr:hypothetical protein [Candidatus Eremiobacteraeota bacterium]
AAASTTRAIARALGASDRATPDDIVNLLDGASRADYRAMLAVTSNGYPNDANLVRGIALAQRLRKDYAAHGRHGT